MASAPLVSLPFILNYAVDGFSVIRHILMTNQIQVNYARGNVTLNIAHVSVDTIKDHPLTLAVVTDSETPRLIVNFTVNGNIVASRTITTNAKTMTQHTLSGSVRAGEVTIDVESAPGMVLQAAPPAPVRSAPAAPTPDPTPVIAQPAVSAASTISSGLSATQSGISSGLSATASSTSTVSSGLSTTQSAVSSTSTVSSGNVTPTNEKPAK